MRRVVAMSFVSFGAFVSVQLQLVIIQFALQKIIQNKLQKLFNTNVIITFNKITKTGSSKFFVFLCDLIKILINFAQIFTQKLNRHIEDFTSIDMPFLQKYLTID